MNKAHALMFTDHRGMLPRNIWPIVARSSSRGHGKRWFQKIFNGCANRAATAIIRSWSKSKNCSNPHLPTRRPSEFDQRRPTAPGPARPRTARSKIRETARGRRAAARRSARNPETAPEIARSRSRLRAAPAPCRRIDGRRWRRRDAGSGCGRCRGFRDRRIARDRGWRRRCTASPGCRREASTPPSSTGSVVMRLPSWFELSNRRISSTAVLIRSGCSISRCFCAGLPDSATSPLPIRLVVVSCPALSRKMQLCSNSFSVSRSPLSSPWIRRVSTSRSGLPGLARRRATRISR